MEIRSLRREDFEFKITMESRWRDMDGLRHINHATYLTYLETARINYLMKLGLNVSDWEAELSTILASMHIDYIQQSSFPNHYDIGSRIIRLGKKSFDLFNAIFGKENEKPIVTGTFTLVTFNYNTQETIPLPKIIKDAYQPF